MKKNILKPYTISCIFFLLLCCQQLIAQPLPNLQTRIFNEANLLRKNPALYYQNHKNLFDKHKSAAVFFRFVGPAADLIWSDSLHKEAKNEVLTNYKSDGRFRKNFCGSSGFGAIHQIEDSVVMKFIIDNYTTLLSTDYNAIGIYSESKNERYFNKDHFYKTSYAFVGTHCHFKPKKYSYPAETFFIDSNKIDCKMLNTGANATYMNAKEKEMLKEINLARCYPKIYAKIIANYLIEKGNDLSFNDYVAGQEIFEELNNMATQNKLLPDERLYKSAKTHGQDLVKRGYGGHTGSDNSSPFDRIKKMLGAAYIEGQENLVGGSSPSGSVMNLLIDGGIGSRGHRYNIINPEWTHAGCYWAGKVGDCPNYYVQNFAIIK
jgi:uncharacterized protein YkwD